MFIRTERLFLRPGWPEDSEEVLTLLHEEEVARNVPAASLPTSAREVRETLQEPRGKLMPYFFITIPAGRGTKLVGCIWLFKEGPDTELFCWIGKDYRGRGYATEAVRAVVTQARALGYRRILASHFADNKGAAQVLKEVGFEPTGETRKRFCAGRGGDVTSVIYVADCRASFGGGDDDGSEGDRQAA